jgi:hypothetical protein
MIARRITFLPPSFYSSTRPLLALRHAKRVQQGSLRICPISVLIEIDAVALAGKMRITQLLISQEEFGNQLP